MIFAMRYFFRIALLSSLMFSSATATPSEALRIQKAYQLAMEKWTLE